MINETYKSMLSGKSVIRELNEYANDTWGESAPFVTMKRTVISSPDAASFGTTRTMRSP